MRSSSLDRHLWVPAAVTALILALLSSCDDGLGPISNPSGISGVLRFKNWPRADSVQELRLVAFKQYPHDSTLLLLEYALGRAAVYPPIGSTAFPKFLDSIPYSFTTEHTTLQVDKYDYIVVAWRYGRNPLVDWRPAGVYTIEPSTFNPAPVRILLHRIIPEINIECDFSNPPPRPWR